MNSSSVPEFSHRFSQYNEIYTQIKVPKNPHFPGKSMPKSMKALRGSLDKIDPSIFVHIFRFLNVIELFVIQRVCNSWRKIIENEAGIFRTLDLVSLPKKVNSLNIIKLVGRGREVKKLALPDSISISDTSYLLMMITENLDHLQINNLNLDFANLFPKDLKSLKTLELNNRNGRTKNLDDNELKALTTHLPNIRELFLNKSPISDKSFTILLPNYTYLETLTLLRCPYLTNSIFAYLAKYCSNLKKLEIGGEPRNYNMNFSIDGFRALVNIKSSLEEIRIEYCYRVGNKTLELLAKRFEKSLKVIEIIRNCFEKSSKISDEGLESLKHAPNIENLAINYSRKFREKAHIHIAKNLHKLRILNLRECILQEDLSLFKTECPGLEEVNLAGNSWVKSTSLMGLSKHPNIRILHLGHFEHSESSCDDNLQEYPPKGMFIEAVFKKTDTFVKLHTLYLEQECSLSYWLDVRIKKIRPKLTIKYTQTDNLLTKI